MYEKPAVQACVGRNIVLPANSNADENVFGIIPGISNEMSERFQDVEELVGRIEGALALVA